MSHEVETAMFVGQPAWHGLGTVLESAPTIAEAIVAAGLDWKVDLLDLCLKDEAHLVSRDDHADDERMVRTYGDADDERLVPQLSDIPARVTMRSTDRSILGVVGPEFTPLQNADAFGFFQPFLDNGTARLEAAGSLRMGKRVWVLASINQQADIVEGDEVRNYVLLAHGHDGSLAIRVGFTMVRVVCANTLSASLSDGSSKLVKINHRKHAPAALRMVQDAMQLATKDFQATTEVLRGLAKIDCTEELLKRYTREVFGAGNANDDDASKRIVGNVLRLAEQGRGTEVPGVRGTMWGAFNAVTEYLTHERGKSDDSRVESQWFGDSAMLTERALMLAIEVAGGRRVDRLSDEE